jgi:hypothetical protein
MLLPVLVYVHELAWCYCQYWYMYMMLLPVLVYVHDVIASIGICTWCYCQYWYMYMMLLTVLVYVHDVIASIGICMWTRVTVLWCIHVICTSCTFSCTLSQPTVQPVQTFSFQTEKKRERENWINTINRKKAMAFVNYMIQERQKRCKYCADKQEGVWYVI